MKTSIVVLSSLIIIPLIRFLTNLWSLTNSAKPVLAVLPVRVKKAGNHQFNRKSGALLVSFCLSVALMCCHSQTDENTVTPVSQQASTNGDYAKCKVNGVLSKDDGSGSILSSIEYDYKGKPTYIIFLPMKVGGDLYKDLFVQFELSNFNGKYVYRLTPSVDNASLTYFQRPTGDSFESPHINGKGTMEITEYVPKKYIKGKFEFTTKNGSRTFEVKEGEFQVEVDF